MNILEHLSHSQGITVVFVTHDMVLAQRADRIVYMHDGRLQETAPGAAMPRTAQSQEVRHAH
jgi:ABC-type lipoprotein export system ATPase subunit